MTFGWLSNLSYMCMYTSFESHCPTIVLSYSFYHSLIHLEVASM